MTLALSACAAAFAAPTPGPIRAEIDALLTKLQSSGCDFDRNGTWHSGADAKDHLMRKLDYIEGKTTLRSTEQFIELAATKSSFSGKPYQVRCGKERAVESQQWLGKQLSVIRSSGVQAKP
ncbi:MAG: DUF5329 domain-containing protein [Proteobacteria bacterium]|nr:DUF5329 domain-containing protein [Pseudomonadota bacterium]